MQYAECTVHRAGTQLPARSLHWYAAGLHAVELSECPVKDQSLPFPTPCLPAETGAAGLSKLAEVVASRFSSTPGALELGTVAADFHLRVKGLVASGKLHLAAGYKATPWRLMQAASAAAMAASGADACVRLPVVSLAASLRLSYLGLAADEHSQRLVVDALQQALQPPQLRKATYSALTDCHHSGPDVRATSEGMATVETMVAGLCRVAARAMASDTGSQVDFVLQVSAVYPFVRWLSAITATEQLPVQPACAHPC